MRSYILLLAIVTTPFLSSPLSARADDTPPDDQLYHPDETPPPAEQQTNVFIKPHATYRDASPNLGFSLGLAPNAFGGAQIAPAQKGETARGMEFLMDWQPRFLQGTWGLFDFGGFVTIYPVNTSLFAALDGTVKTIFSVWEPGAMVRYQARFFKEQMIVPIVAYSISSLHYSFGNPSTSSGVIPVNGPALGAWFLLNSLSRSEAEDFYENWGVARSYLTFEARKSDGSSSSTLNATSLYFGLRMEF